MSYYTNGLAGEVVAGRSPVDIALDRASRADGYVRELRARLQYMRSRAFAQRYGGFVPGAEVDLAQRMAYWERVRDEAMREAEQDDAAYGLSGLGSPAAAHEAEAEAARKRALARADEAMHAIKEGWCGAALYGIRSAAYAMGEFGAEVEGIGGDPNNYGYALLGVSQALEVVEGAFVKKCLRR